jgi:hypothetical protein
MKMAVFLLRLVVRYKFTDVSEVLVRAIFKAMSNNKHLWNVGKLLPEYTAQQPKRQPCSIP